ncbi:MAG: beta-propeller fold lactonase family protein [Spirochaetes bacterium]|nr:beta-propeller fold lactonase family protein [Spirochaetota bacterium]
MICLNVCGAMRVSVLSSVMLISLNLGCIFAQRTVVSDTETVGKSGANRIVLPVNQIITPIGKQVIIPKLRPQGLALSPDGQILVASGKTSELIVLDPASAEIRKRVKLPAEAASNDAPNPVSPLLLKPDDKGQLSYTGLIFSRAGKRIYFANVDGSIKVFKVEDGTNVVPWQSWALPPANAPRRKKEIPSGLAVSADDKRLYVCANLGNRLLEIDTESGSVLRQFDTGVAPFDVVLVKNTAWVSDWGGRRPSSNDLTGPIGRGTSAKVDARYIASEGAVTVVDLATGSSKDIVTGLHTCAIAVSPDERYVIAANAGQDNISVIEVEDRELVSTIWAKPNPAELLGATPNALVFSPDGKTLWAANGTQNAVAVFSFESSNGTGELRGLLPSGWFPCALVMDKARGQLVVANIKGMQPDAKTVGKSVPDTNAQGYNTHQYAGSLSFISLSATNELAVHSTTVWNNLRRERIVESLLPPRAGQKPMPVPERIGEPSTIKHVIYIIKENRTYDQVFGDIPRGNGHPGLCVFGERITPNQHKFVDEFVLLDNTYCCGLLSADGHQWSDTAFSSEYMERSFAGFPRSYPGGTDADVLAFSSAGCIWDNVIKHRLSIRNYGEFMEPITKWKDAARKGTVTWTDCWNTWKGDDDSVRIASFPSVESLRPFSPTNTIGWNLKVPDQFRADFFLRELAAFEKSGDLPRFIILYLPNDHNNGTVPGMPTPAAYTADNDLAFGRVVEGLSRSRFWKDTAIFAIEDDPQSGWDHVSGYRTTAYVISPWARRHAVVSTQYNTTSLLRTMEQILGLPPMNQFDASAVPMRDCFTNVPDFTPFKAVSNNIPLNELNPDLKKIGDADLKRDAVASMQMNFEQVDRIPEMELNRIIWRAMRGKEPYPVWASTSGKGRDDD